MENINSTAINNVSSEQLCIMTEITMECFDMKLKKCLCDVRGSRDVTVKTY